MDQRGSEYWDRWWQARLPKGCAEALRPVSIPRHRSGAVDGPWGVLNGRYVTHSPVHSDHLLLAVMAESGLRRVPCAGNGPSQEPRELPEAGCHVTASDISAVATRFAEARSPDPTDRHWWLDPEMSRPGGCVEFIVGDLLDPRVCPGPFDVVIERRTVQVFDEAQRADALSALSKRLSRIGIFLSMCLDDSFPMEWGWAQHESGFFHSSESWFQEEGWTIWDGVPSSPLQGRVAWLVRCGSMKPPPREGRANG